jgi:hypothetical protein
MALIRREPVPVEGHRRELLCPACRERTVCIAVFATVWDDESCRREFSGWQCSRCGIQHSGA